MRPRPSSCPSLPNAYGHLSAKSRDPLEVVAGHRRSAHAPHLAAIVPTLLLLLALLSVLMASSPIATQGGTALRFAPEDEVVQVGDLLDVDVMIDDVQRLYGLEVGIAFDPQVLWVEDADPWLEGPQVIPGSFPRPDFVVVNEAHNGKGTIQYAVIQVPPAGPMSGSGRVCTLQFRGRAPGLGELYFSLAEVADSDGITLPVTLHTAHVGVVAVATETPTPSSTGTPTATGTATATASTTASATLTETATETQTPTTSPTATSTPTTLPTSTQTPVAPTVPASPTPVSTVPPPTLPAQTPEPASALYLPVVFRQRSGL